jgi:predicted dehydrogenase
MSDLRVGVIGCGHWGPNHIRVFSQLSGAVVTSAADPDPMRRAAVTTQYPDIACVLDHRELLRRRDVDAVVVAVPTALHNEVARDALEAGKHVLCEKPLCTDVSQAEALIALAYARSLVLMTGHVFLFNPGIVMLKNLIDAGHVGRLYYFRSLRTNDGPIRSDVNCVYDLVSHDVAIFAFLLGGLPLSVSATGAAFLQPGIEDLAFITLRFPRDVVAQIQASWLDPRKCREIVVVGDRKMIVWDDLSPTGPVKVYHKGLVREGDVVIPRVAPDEPLKIQNTHFLEAVQQGSAIRSDGHFALGVLRTLEAITASMGAGGASVCVPA